MTFSDVHKTSTALPKTRCVLGSVTGSEHVRRRRNNQDAVALEVSEDRVVLVVTDGCGSARASEVGARLGAAFLANHFSSRPFAEAFEDAGLALVEYLGVVAAGFGSGERRTLGIADHLLFTFLAGVIEPERAFVVGVGDGVILSGAERRVLLSGAGNAPAYAAYDLVPQSELERSAIAHSFARPIAVSEANLPAGRIHSDRAPPILHLDVPTSSLSLLGLGTDGVEGLLAQADRLTELLEAVERSGNPFSLQRELMKAAEGPRGLADDTTLALAFLPKVEGPPCS